MIRLLIIDDHALIRRGLIQIFEETPDIRVVDEAANGQEAISKIRENNYDVVILDLSLPGRNGLDVLKQIKCLNPELQVLVLSIYPPSQYAVRVLKAGASSYLCKDSQPEELIEAVRKLAEGKKHLTSQIVETLVDQLNNKNSDLPYNELSDREYQVLTLLASGHSISEIAKELNISIKTVSTYRSRLLKKLKLRNNAELICYAIKQGLISN